MKTESGNTFYKCISAHFDFVKNRIFILHPFPSSGSAAGQYQSAFGYRKADLVGFHMAAEPFGDGGVDHI